MIVKREEIIRNKQRGFSLIEIMVVMLTIAILATLALPMYTKMIARSRSADGSKQLAILKARQDVYRASRLTYASNLSLLPGYSGVVGGKVTIGRYQIYIDAGATANTFKGIAEDITPIGSLAAKSDRWEITEIDKEPQHISKGY